MGCGDLLARSAIRFSIGRFTTAEEIDYAIEVVRKGVMRLRELSPLWELWQADRDPIRSNLHSNFFTERKGI
jgi:cysteine desulfurase